MKKLSIILIALIAFAQTTWAQSPPFGGGSGTQSNPYLINNETHWINFCYALENNTTWSQYSDKYYKLGADIGTSTNPVNTMAGSEGHTFCGTFDGNGKTIHIGLNSTGNYTAIFRCVSNDISNSATIKNLNVEGTVTAKGNL